MTDRTYAYRVYEVDGFMTKAVYEVDGFMTKAGPASGASVYARHGFIIVRPDISNGDASFDEAGAEALIEALRAALGDLRAAKASATPQGPADAA